MHHFCSQILTKPGCTCLSDMVMYVWLNSWISDLSGCSCLFRMLGLWTLTYLQGQGFLSFALLTPDRHVSMCKELAILLFRNFVSRFMHKIWSEDLFWGDSSKGVFLEGHCKRNHANYVILWSCWVSLLSNVVPLEYYAMLWNVGTSALGLVVFI